MMDDFKELKRLKRLEYEENIKKQTLIAQEKGSQEINEEINLLIPKEHEIAKEELKKPQEVVEKFKPEKWKPRKKEDQ